MKKLIICLTFLLHSSFATAGELISVDPAQLANNISKTPGDKILFLFASWCGPCKETIQTIDDAKNIIFISIDKNAKDIKEFVDQMKYNVYHLNPTDENLLSLTDSLNIKFAEQNKEGGVSWGIPYLALLDKNNKVLKANFPKEELHKYLK
jgi:thiol-disulfide isomerase/thioredoxin